MYKAMERLLVRLEVIEENDIAVMVQQSYNTKVVLLLISVYKW